MRRSLVVFALLIGFTLNSFAQTAEPSFCRLDQFKSRELSFSGPLPKRLHAYKLGSLTLAGMAVGDSDPQDIVALATQVSASAAPENYCTWYFNEGNSQAERLFNWHDLPKPTGSNYEKESAVWLSLIGDQFDQSAVSFLSCAVHRHYIGLGCNGQRHRGPTVFAMILGYAGCSPQHAADIVDEAWGNNGIKAEMRMALAQKGADLAALHPVQSVQFRNLLLK